MNGERDHFAIPNDSIASAATAGILGETYVAIDASHASGAPIGANAVLKTTPTTELSTHEMLEKFGEVNPIKPKKG